VPTDFGSLPLYERGDCRNLKVSCAWASLNGMKPAVLLFAIAFVIGSSAPSAAEARQAGGSFCTAKGYLAYYDRQEDSNYRLTAHWLRIVRFGAEGIHSAGPVSLPIDFGWPWMYCDNDRVELAGPRHYPYFKKCFVNVENKAIINGSAECYEDSIENLAKFGGEPDSLAAFGSDESSVQLESSDPNHTYELLRHSSSRRIGNEIEWHDRSEIVGLDLKGTVVQRALIYDTVTVVSLAE
jgi:hypothetical protein